MDEEGIREMLREDERLDELHVTSSLLSLAPTLLSCWQLYQQTAMASDDVVVELDETREISPDKIVNVRILRVPKSDKFPTGVKYGFNYTEKGCKNPILRYDNHHGYGTHERHEGDSVEELDEFPGVEPLLRDFLEEIGIEL